MTRFPIPLLAGALLVLLGPAATAAPDPLKQGLESFQAGRFHEARLALTRAAESGVKDGRLYPALFRTLVLAEANGPAGKLVAEHPEILSDGAALLDYAAMLMSTNAYEAAQTLLARSERSARYYELQLRYLGWKKDIPAMRQILVGQGRRVPEKAFQAAKAMILDAYEAELEVIRQSGDLARGILLCQNYLALEKSPFFQIQLSALYYRQGEYDAALRNLKSLDPAGIGDGKLVFQYHKITGMALSRKKKPAEAVAALKQAVAAGGLDFDVAYYLAEGQRRSGDLAAAEAFARQAVSLKSGRESLYLLALILVDAGKNTEAKDALAKYLAVAPDDGRTREVFQRISAVLSFEEALNLYKSGRYGQAAVVFERAQQEDPPPGQPMIRVMWANALYMEGNAQPQVRADRYARAEKVAEPMVGDPALLLSVYDVLFNIYTERKDFGKAETLASNRQKVMKAADDRFYLDRGYQAELQKRYPEALEHYEKAYGMTPSSEAKRKVLLTLYNLTTAALNARNLSNAARYLDRAEKIDAKDRGLAPMRKALRAVSDKEEIDRKFTAAEKAYGEKNFEGAISLYKEIEAMAGDVGDLSANMASTYFEMKRYREAYEYYRADDGKNRSFYGALGSLYCLYRMDRFREVLAQLPAVMARFPQVGETRDLVKLQVQVLRALGMNGEAMAVLTRRTAEDGTYGAYWLLLGNLAFEEKDYDRAQECYTRAGAENFLVTYNLGVLNLKKGRLAEALRYLGKARTLVDGKKSPELAEGVLYQLAQVAYKMGNQDDAEAHVEALLESHLGAAETRARPDVNYLWWYALIQSANGKKMADPARKARVLEFLDTCASQKGNRAVSTRAAYLKVVLNPSAHSDIANPIKDLSASTPLALGDLLVYQSQSGEIVAVSEETGATNWTMAERAPLSAPMVHDGRRIAYALESGIVQVCDEVSGASVARIQTWARGLHLSDRGLATLSKEELILWGEKGHAPLFRASVSNLEPMRLVGQGETVVVAGKRGARIFDLARMRAIGELPREGYGPCGYGGLSIFAAVVSSNAVVVDLFSLQQAKPAGSFEIRWPTRTGDEFLLGANAFVVIRKVQDRKGGDITAFDLGRGAPLWSWTRPEPLSGVVLNRDALYVTTSTGSLVKIAMDGGKPLWEHSLQAGKQGIYTVLVRK